MRPWTTTHDANKSGAHDYRTYLAQVEQVTGVKGDPRGVHGYGSPLPPPLAEVPAPGGDGRTTAVPGYDQISSYIYPSARGNLAQSTRRRGLTDGLRRRSAHPIDRG